MAPIAAFPMRNDAYTPLANQIGERKTPIGVVFVSFPKKMDSRLSF